MNKMSLKIFATSLTSIVFIIIGVSGIMLYLHVLKSSVKEVHEIMGLAFIAAAVLHLFFNFKSMKKHFTKKIFITSLLVISVVSLAIIYDSSSNSKSSPKTMLAKKVLKAPIDDSLKILNINYANAKKLLEAKGIKIEDYKSINDVASANKMSPYDIVAILVLGKK